MDIQEFFELAYEDLRQIKSRDEQFGALYDLAEEHSEALQMSIGAIMATTDDHFNLPI